MMNSSGVAVKTDRLTVYRGGVEVLHALDLTVRAGVVTGLLGPSGCGKSTLMRCIVGTQIVRSGEVTVLGQPAGHPELRTRVGYGTQNASIYADLTVRENLSYFATVLGAPSSEVQRVIDLVDLGVAQDRLAGKLSGGQLSRANLAAALLGAPEVLVLDEPTVGLDPLLRESLWALFRELAASGITLLVSSHVMDEAERCDEILLMRDGRMLAQDTPARLKERTKAADLNQAFLTLIGSESAA